MFEWAKLVGELTDAQAALESPIKQRPERRMAVFGRSSPPAAKACRGMRKAISATVGELKTLRKAEEVTSDSGDAATLAKARQLLGEVVEAGRCTAEQAAKFEAVLHAAERNYAASRPLAKASGPNPRDLLKAAVAAGRVPAQDIPKWEARIHAAGYV